MPKHSKPRAGSLQFWPRKRSDKFLPRVNWEAIDSKNNSKLLGVIGYKVGMTSCLVKDITEKSMTKDKRIVVPATIIELPNMKVFSVRFYKYGKVVTEILSENLDKKLKSLLKLPKIKSEKKIEEIKDYEDIKLILYSKIKDTDIKSTPDMTEIGLTGTKEEKFNFVKEHLNKEISSIEILKNLKLIDVRGLTKGKGIQGPVKRFGITLKAHKTEKGRRKTGNLGPWNPSYVSFRIPMAGQMGMFTRVQYNNKIIKLGKIQEKDINPSRGFEHFGKVKSDYTILEGSVQGPQKRQVLLTVPLRPTRKQEKKTYEFLRIEK